MTTKPKLIRSFATVALMFMSFSSFADEPIKELRVDWAYHSPSSLVLKHFGWLEQDFKKDGIAVRWLQSQGSNKALEYLNSNSTDFGSTAGLSALLAKANGNPIKNVYIYSQPAWTALVVSPNLSIVCYHGFYPYVGEMIGVAFRSQNVYVVPDMYIFLPGGSLYVEATNGFMRDQLLFGTSYPFRAMGRTVEDFLALGLTEQVLDAVLFDNAVRLLKLDV
ncbi:exported hypothetical protein [Candidatus Methylobacter favarea]|uniref:SsuA/THI5-like domain-containing protein n=1 Tax=Candidatus Methylobacter favarea TaxID=2707345 RepID=A0A8S0XHU9_9GAMM|nr:amidohydrolase family protein [Candidatus Methylobacter favarea]CAA9890053.1 exported hypothetical protein [Candidatus Methylobacter favarea]